MDTHIFLWLFFRMCVVYDLNKMVGIRLPFRKWERLNPTNLPSSYILDLKWLLVLCSLVFLKKKTIMSKKIRLFTVAQLWRSGLRLLIQNDYYVKLSKTCCGKISFHSQKVWEFVNSDLSVNIFSFLRPRYLSFNRFRSSNFEVEDASRTGRPITEKVESDRHVSTYNIAKDLNILHQTLLKHLKITGYKKKLEL